MNRIITTLIAIATCGIVSAQTQEEERARLASAKVKTQLEFTHDFKDGKPDAEGYKSAERTYDTKGNLMQETNFNAAGKVLSVVNYQYDNQNRMVNFERYQGNKEKLQYSQKTVYNAANKKTREYGFDGVSQYSNSYMYDKSGKLIEIEYTTDNTVVEDRVLTSEGNQTTIRIYDADGRELFRQLNTYNAKGNVLTEVKSDASGKEIYAFTNVYKDDELLTSMSKKRNGSIQEFQKFFTYDDKKRLVKEETISLNDVKFISHEYEYNADSFLSKEAWKKSVQAKEFSSNRFGYDAKGLYAEKESYFATYKLYSLYKYKYEYYE